MAPRVVCFIVENRYGNFVPTVAALEEDENGGQAMLIPVGNSIPHIMLKDAQRFLVRHSPARAIVFLNPVQPAVQYPLAVMLALNKEE